MIDAVDMGPFASLDANTLSAIRNRVSLGRGTVRVSVREVGHYSFDGELPNTLQGWIDWLEAARQEVPEQYRDQLHCEVEWESGYYDSGDSASVKIWYDRPETDDEMMARAKSALASIRDQERRELAEYQRLKRRFETPTE